MNKILVTGTAGFIGFHLAQKLTSMGFEVVGLDSINDYYDVRLKYARLDHAGIAKADIGYNKLCQSNISPKYRFIQLQLEDKDAIKNYENLSVDPSQIEMVMIK